MDPTSVEAEYTSFYQSFPAQVLGLHIQNAAGDPASPSRDQSLVLFGRLISIFGADLLSVGNADFHTELQNALLSLLSRSDFSGQSRLLVSTAIARCAATYSQCGGWPTLPGSILALADPGDHLTLSIIFDCLAQCLNNRSIEIPQIRDALLEFVGLLQPDFPSFFLLSLLRLIYAAYWTEPMAIHLIELIQTFPPRDVQTGLSDLVRYYTDFPQFVSQSVAYVYVPQLMSLASSDSVPTGARVCCLFFLARLIGQHPLITDISENPAVSPPIPIALVINLYYGYLSDPCEDLAREAEETLSLLCDTFGATEGFIMPCFDLAATDPNRVSALTLLRFTCNVVEYFTLASDAGGAWDLIAESIMSPDPAVRDAGLRCACTFCDAFAARDEGFLPELSSGVEVILEALARETEPAVWDTGLSALCSFAAMVEPREPAELEPVVAFLFAAVPEATAAQLPTMLRILKASRRSLGEASGDVARLCLQLIGDMCETVPREVFLGALNAFLFLPEATDELCAQCLAALLMFCRSDMSVSEIESVNESLAVLIREHPQVVAPAGEEVCAFLLQGLCREIGARESPWSAEEVDFADENARPLRERNVVIYYSAEDIQITVSFLATLRHCFAPPLAQFLEESGGLIGSRLAELLELTFNINLIQEAFGCLPRFVQIAPPEAVYLLLERAQLCILAHGSVEDLECLPPDFVRLARRALRRFPSPELVDFVTRAVLLISAHVARQAALAAEWTEAATDFRTPELVPHCVDVQLGDLLGDVFAVPGAAPAVDWAAAIPMTVPRVLAIHAYAHYYRNVAPCDEILAFLVAAAGGSLAEHAVAFLGWLAVSPSFPPERLPLVIETLVNARANHPQHIWSAIAVAWALVIASAIDSEEVVTALLPEFVATLPFRAEFPPISSSLFQAVAVIVKRIPRLLLEYGNEPFTGLCQFLSRPRSDDADRQAVRGILEDAEWCALAFNAVESFEQIFGAFRLVVCPEEAQICQ
jgi:hypothetical protein